MKRIFSGIKPSGELTLGNYLGALRNFVTLQHTSECVFCVADLHAITVAQEPKGLRKRTMDIARLFVASGIDPQVSSVVIQSHIPAHSELGWLLGCFTGFGELSRMTQFKEKSENKPNVSVGLFTYPCLMAADILLYDTDQVPVGEDQKQHLELSRDIALRMNNRFGADTFRVPEPYTAPRSGGGRIMSLQNPAKKMAKSDDDAGGAIELLDAPSVIRKKVMSAVTDSDRDVRYDEESKPAVSNLMVIYSLCSGESMEVVAEKFGSAGYGTFKKAIAEAVVSTLEPIQKRYEELGEPGVMEAILDSGRQKVEPIANATLRRVRGRMGFVLPE